MGVIILDRFYQISGYNSCARTLLGTDKVLTDSSRLKHLMGPDYTLSSDYKAREVILPDDTGDKTLLLSQATLHEDGIFTGIMIILKDISDQKANENEIKILNEQLRNHVKKKSMELADAKKELVKTGYKSEIADLTTGTLHNVKNILNSIKVSASIAGKILTGSSVKGFGMANKLLSENMENINGFIKDDPKGLKLLEYYLKLDETLSQEVSESDYHMGRLLEKVNLIEQIVTAQQSAGGRDSVESMDLETIIEDSLILHSDMIKGYDIQITKQFSHTHVILFSRIKLIHILSNLVKNAKEAMLGTEKKNRHLTIETESDDTHVYMKITDNGCGISEDNLNQMFTYGFTTKKDGHGYGLHSCRQYMRDYNGDLIVTSDGEKLGSTFILKFSNTPVFDFSIKETRNTRGIYKP